MIMRINKHYIQISLSALFFLLCTGFNAHSLVPFETDWQTNDIEPVNNSFYKRSGGDPFIIFPKMAEIVRSPRGVRFVIAFTPAITKPFLAELFWKPEMGGFSEADKVFFILHPGTDNTLDFIVPLRRDVGYDQIRFDLPRDLDSSFSILKHELVELNSQEISAKIVEPFSSLNAMEAKSLDILIPYIFHAIKHGCQRLVSDLPFFFFWIALIVITLFGIRIIARKKLRK
jgi:hypothetical protein